MQVISIISIMYCIILIIHCAIFMPFRGKLELQNWLLEEKRFVLHVYSSMLYAGMVYMIIYT